MSETKQGICLECGKPLQNPASFGYHYNCADIAHERTNKEADEKFPFVVVDSEGCELDRFNTQEKADEYLYRIRNAEIERK